MTPAHALHEYLFTERLNCNTMSRALKRHDMSDGEAVVRIEADCILRSNGEVNVFFGIDGHINKLVIPALKKGGRHDRLWRTTCVELFAWESGADVYWEFNFSPSTDWAAYRFNAYRSGRQDEKEVSIIDVDVQQNVQRLEMNIVIAPGPTLNFKSKKLMIGLSAIIEEIDGGKSYWALEHPPAGPDFHNKVCFALDKTERV